MSRPALSLTTAALLALVSPLSGCTQDGAPHDPDGDDRTGDGGDPDAGPGDAGVLPTDRCDVSPGAGDAFLYRGRVLTPSGPLARGEVAVEDARIVCVGEECAADYPDATVIECGGAVISPALINPHEHMRFNELGPLDLDETRYDHRHEWRGELSAPQNPSGTAPGSPGMRWNELRQLMAGTTTVVGSGSPSGLVRHLDNLRPRDRELGLRQVIYETFPLGDAGAAGDDPLVPPETCGGWNFRHDAFDAAMAPAYLPHVAEGIDDYAAEEYRCQSQEVEDGGRDFVQPNASHIHAIGLTAEDLHRMARARSRLVWSPRTNIALYGVTADVSTFHRFGGEIALGTDWAYTGSANMLRELTCADSYNRDYLSDFFSDRELWEMATENAALAAGNHHALGSLEEGKVADLLVVDGAPGDYRAVLEAGSDDILLVSVSGEPIYGDADILEAARGERCDPIDVCGSERGVCLSARTGQSYAELEAAVSEDAYPAFFCADPPDEPTCVPSRPGEYSGEPGGGDSVGDGVPDDVDLCPEVFHPIRPIDDGAQPDADGDGVGDPCDEDPVLDDISGDGVPNEDDNCPYDANPDQIDSSGDGTGDVCDACPDVTNPDSPCPPPSITTIRDIHDEADEGDDVVVLGAVVTGVYENGATIQDPDPEGGDRRRSGLSVFTFDEPTHVEVGDVVHVVGEKDLHFGNVEIGAADINPIGRRAEIEPTPVSTAEAASDDYQGVLARVTGAEVTDDDYDCAQDHPDCEDDGLWEIEDAGGGGARLLVFDRLYQDGDWSERVGELPAAGVVMFRFERHRLMPRSGDDFE